MTSAYVPYNGTAGHAGTDTSKQRALYNLRTGKEYNNQQKALAYLKIQGTEGATWKELANAMEWHHGTASGVLSVLHKSGAIIRLVKARNRSKIYVHQDYKENLIHEVYIEKKKLCPHCGNDINA